MDFIKNLIPFPSIKLPKLKKLRQWSHDSLANLSSQLTNSRLNNVNPKHSNSRASLDETAFPTNGISTISSAIREQKIDPKRDNHGLYALKCDRSSSLANARRGILLNLPTTMIKTKAEINSFHSMERNHEVFKSCETSVDPTAGTPTTMYDGATSSPSGNESKVKIEPPPRRKKRPTATRQIVAKPHKKPNLKQANQCVVKAESLEKNDSSLYRIVNSSETAKVAIEEAKRREHVVTMVKPKVQKAVAVKAKPVQQQVAKVKSYEWNKHQRKASIGNVIKPHFTKRYVASESSGSFKSESSVDIFQSNRLMDQKKVFDEFDALFDKSRDLSEASPESAFSKLKALKFESSHPSFHQKGVEEKLRPAFMSRDDDTVNPSPANVKSQDFCQKNSPRGMPPSRDSENVSSKPKIIHEQPKAATAAAAGGIIKKKILYYDDKHEFQQLIMNQTQATTIINNHFNAAVLPSAAKSVEGKVPISCNPQSVVDSAATGQFDLNGNDACDDYQRSYHNPKTTTDTSNSNSLRIFSNEGIFVFNL